MSLDLRRTIEALARRDAEVPALDAKIMESDDPEEIMRLDAEAFGLDTAAFNNVETGGTSGTTARTDAELRASVGARPRQGGDMSDRIQEILAKLSTRSVDVDNVLTSEDMDLVRPTPVGHAFLMALGRVPLEEVKRIAGEWRSTGEDDPTFGFEVLPLRFLVGDVQVDARPFFTHLMEELNRRVREEAALLLKKGRRGRGGDRRRRLRALSSED